MAQRISHKWKDEIKSYEANEHLFSVLDAGVLRGFDLYTEEAATPGTIGFAVAHSGPTGLTKSKQDNTLESNIGMHLTKNGSLVVETAQLTGFTFDVSFSTTNNKRYWLIAEHEFTELAGGSPCTYSVIGGALGTGTTYADPVLPNPEKQVALLQFDVPVGSVASRTFAAIVSNSNPDDYSKNVVLWQFGFGRTRTELKQVLGYVTDIQLHDELTAYYTSSEVDTELHDLYDSIVNDLVEVWIAATASGFVTNNPSTSLWGGGRALSYRRTLDNKVELGGSADVTNPSAQTTMFTLPVGYRPTVEQWISAKTISADAAQGSAIKIETNGDVKVYTGAGLTAVTLDGIIFSLA